MLLFKYMRGKCDDKEGDSSRAHLFPTISGYKRGGDIAQGDNTQVMVYSLLSVEGELMWK